MKRVHVLESYREFPDGLIGPDAERDRGWGMEDGFGAAWMKGQMNGSGNANSPSGDFPGGHFYFVKKSSGKESGKGEKMYVQ